MSTDEKPPRLSDLDADVEFTRDDGLKVTIQLREGSFRIVGAACDKSVRDAVVERLVSWCARIARLEGYNRSREVPK